jgi:hypothetical protein
MASEPSGDQPQALRPASGGGRTFLGVRRMEPHDDGVRLLDETGAELGVVRYGEQVYVNGRVVSFTPPKTG